MCLTYVPRGRRVLSRRTGAPYCGGVPSGPRLRQVALVARDCGQVAGELRRVFGWAPPFHDQGVGQFGLTNAVCAVGDTFVEVVAPARPGTTAGRYLERRGGDGGDMALFQGKGPAAARPPGARVGGRGGWPAALPDIAATHLHPGDVPGAIVSLDWADPEQSWRWAGPSWTGRVPDYAPGGGTGLTIEVGDPPVAAQRWAAVLGIPAPGRGSTTADGPITVDLPDSGQRLRFLSAGAGRGQGLTEVTIAGLPAQGGAGPWVIGGVRFAGEEG